jgi:very-short-patch-repair endonuclease
LPQPAVGELIFQCRVARLPTPVVEHRFHPTRRWKFDLAFLAHWLAVEVDGGMWTGKSRHRTGTGYTEDCVKVNEAICAGWTVLRVTPEHVKRGDALHWIERALKITHPEGR